MFPYLHYTLQHKMHSTMGNGSPTMVVSCTGGNAIGKILCSSGTKFCASKDMEGPESNTLTANW